MCSRRVSPYQNMHVWDSTGDGMIDFEAADLGVDVLGHIIENQVIQLALIEQLKKGGVAARLDSDPATMLWRKLLWNSGFNAITAITKRFAKQICEDEKRLAIARSAMEETVAVAQAQGITIGEDDIQAQIDVTLTMGPVKTSMWQDIEAGHKTEVEYINGVVVRRGDQRGISVVTNRMLLQEIQAIEGI